MCSIKVFTVSLLLSVGLIRAFKLKMAMKKAVGE